MAIEGRYEEREKRMRKVVFKIWCLAVILLLTFSGCGKDKKPTEEAAKPLELNIQLADTPGPYGHALAYTPWKISQGEEPYGLAFIEDEQLLAEGETNLEGWIKPKEEEKQKIAKAASVKGNRLWLIYPGQVQRIVFVEIRFDWTKEERLFYWLRSEGFMPDREAYSKDFFATDAGRSMLTIARDQYQVENNEKLYAKIDLPKSGWVYFFMQ